MNCIKMRSRILQMRGQKISIWGIVTNSEIKHRHRMPNKIKCNQALTFQVWLSHGEKKSTWALSILAYSKVSLTSG